MSLLIYIFSMLCVLTACSPEPTSERLAGADQDAHGCKGSAGFTWSPVRGECIRIFEAGLGFEPDPAPTQGAVLAAFVVLAPAQGETVKAAEVFVPGRSQPIALTLVHTPEGDIRPTLLENKAEDVRVFRHKDDHVLEVKGQIYRRQSPPEDRLFSIR